MQMRCDLFAVLCLIIIIFDNAKIHFMVFFD
jgi:hypothetical protein